METVASFKVAYSQLQPRTVTHYVQQACWYINIHAFFFLDIEIIHTMRYSICIYIYKLNEKERATETKAMKHDVIAIESELLVEYVLTLFQQLAFNET